ncbi:MAG: sulfite exporter TauE/SafE family protein [Candidatus Hydrogenedentes bacterium]|nr:sulfite exporter TauE/SafE family protein [Candidatus Hydrogenedentota bacterium]
MSGVVVGFAFLFASLVHTITGFGSALVGMPILVLGIGLDKSAPLMALLSQLVNLIVLANNWSGIRWGRSLVLIIPSLFGVPLGLILLKGGNENLLNILLGLILIFHSCFLLFFESKLSIVQISNRMAFLFGIPTGFVAGVLGGAYNVNGPPVIIYTSLFEKEKMKFRSTLQLFFVANGFVIIGGHYFAGLITAEVWKLCFYGVPGLILGTILGVWLDRYITPERFSNIIVVSILTLGTVLILQSIV